MKRIIGSYITVRIVAAYYFVYHSIAILID